VVFVFSARARLGPFLATTQDRYQAGHGDSRIRLLGVIPIVTKRGQDVDRAMRSRVEAERSFGDYTIPWRLRASWWAGTDREFEFFRATVQQAHFSP
jgi:hypothetical protein